jgi:hypothetical protein
MDSVRKLMLRGQVCLVFVLLFLFSFLICIFCLLEAQYAQFDSLLAEGVNEKWLQFVLFDVCFLLLQGTTLALPQLTTAFWAVSPTTPTFRIPTTSTIRPIPPPRASRLSRPIFRPPLSRPHSTTARSTQSTAFLFVAVLFV